VMMRSISWGLRGLALCLGFGVHWSVRALPWLFDLQNGFKVSCLSNPLQ